MRAGIRTFPIVAAASVALLALPGIAAAAEYYVPPDNSAVNQYTESFPSAGGNRGTEHGDDRLASPNKTIGAANTRKLDEQGGEGEVTAQVAARTSPSTSEAAAPAPDEGDRGKGERDDATGGGGKGDGGGGSAAPAEQAGEAAPGSSWLDSVLAKAFGFGSSGLLGVLVPLVLVAALLWALANLIHLRRRPVA
jgi:hypothetical protein